MRLTLVLYFSLKLVLSKNIDEKDILLVFEQQWPKLHFALICITTLEPTDCGNLYGGSRGACPKSLPISYPCPLPMNCSETESSVSHHLSRFAYKLTIYYKQSISIKQSSRSKQRHAARSTEKIWLFIIRHQLQVPNIIVYL